MALRPDEFANLKGRQHPLYRGVLREAHDNGLLELSVKLVQAPSAENDHCAIVEATAVFPGPEGRERIFTELGDCDNRNATAMITAHKIRMAATRAKGRALRDALGIGEALVEEMGPDVATHAGNGTTAAHGERSNAAAAGQQSRARGSSAPVGQQVSDRSETAGPVVEGSAADPPVAEHWCAGCGMQIKGTTKRPAAEVARLSRELYGAELCVHCVQEKQTLATANVPTGAIAA